MLEAGDSWLLFVLAWMLVGVLAYIVWDWKRRGSP